MKRALSRCIALVLCGILLFSALPSIPAQAGAGDGVVTYRALLIGNAVYDNGQTLQAPVYDASHMEQLLLQQNFSGNRFLPANIVKLNNATKLIILETIKKKLAAKADGDDVTYIYYSGHGTYDGDTSYLVGVEMGLISIDELKAALDQVQGRKVVILDCCYSGGFAGRSVGNTEAVGTTLKSPKATETQKKQKQAAEEAKFQSGLMSPFVKQLTTVQKALSTSSYQVLAAASDYQYSYEYNFYSGSANVASYGPEFKMNGVDLAGGQNNASGEFTGMLVAGAGRVEFNTVFGEVKALADCNRDRKITLNELYRYLSGAVLYSNVQVYPQNDQSVIFEHSAADTPDWDQNVLSVVGNSGPLAPQTNSPVRLALLKSSAWPTQVTITRSTKLGDNRYADNADAVIDSIATVSSSDLVANGSMDTLYWNGKKTDGTQAGDGWCFAQLSNGTYNYPPVPFEVKRGISNFPAAAVLPLNKTFSATLADTSAKLWYTFTPAVDGLLQMQSVNGSAAQNPQVELYDEAGDSLAFSDDQYLDNGDTDYNFKLIRAVKAGQKYEICVSCGAGSGISLSVLCRFITPSANNKLISVDTLGVSYTLFTPDVSGRWTIKATGSYDDDAVGITLYDTWFSPVAYGDRYADSYRYICTYLEAGRTYILETPKISAPLQVAAYGPGKQSMLNTATMAALSTSAGSEVQIAHAYDTKYLRFTPTATNTYRFSSDSPLAGSYNVDSYAFLLDSKGYLLASDDDVNYDTGLLQFDFTARLNAGVTYVLAVRAYVLSGQISSSNTALDFNVYVKPDGTAAQTQAIAAVTAGDEAVIALYDNDGSVANGIGSGGKIAGWGASIDADHEGLTGLDFGEGEYYIRRTAPQLLYMPGNAAVTKVWNVGHAFVARDSARGYYAWGESSDGIAFGFIRRLDNLKNNLARYDISYMVRGEQQSSITFLDKQTDKLYSMADLAGIPTPVSAPAASFVKIGASAGCLLALGSDGKLYASGTNHYGECGNGGTNAVNSLTAISLPNKIIDFATGDNHVVALDNQGNVYTWGCNDYGALGLGSLARFVVSPKRVNFGSKLAAGEGISKVFAGGGCTAVLTSAGRILAWGENDNGQLGIGSTFSQIAPVAVHVLSPTALGASRQVQQIVFGPSSSYAVTNDGCVLVSGKNSDGQLGFVSGDIKSFTPLTQPDLRSSNNRLRSMTLTAGTLSPAFAPGVFEYTVMLPTGVAMSTIKAAAADATATIAIDAQQADSKTINAGTGPVRTVITVTAKNGSKQTYVLNFPQSTSANANLSSLVLSGGWLNSAINATATSYTVFVPETVTGPVLVSPVPADPNSTLLIDGKAGVKNKAVTLSGTQPSQIQVQVKAQRGNSRFYTIAFVRKSVLAGFSGAPQYAGYCSLSPGGTNRAKLQYSLNMPATVKLEVKKGSGWITILSKQESSVGTKTYSWDGKAGGSYLASGTYSIRITPYYSGVAGTQKLLTVKILPKPGITITSLSPTAFKVTGTTTQKITFKQTNLSDVKVEIVTLSGAVVRTVYTKANEAPGSQTVSWNGKSDLGTLLKAGKYKVRITAGAAVVTKALLVTR
jgi:flagellar hook assembly protein FlgD